MTVKILITRPSHSANEFAELLHARIGPDVPLILSPLIEICHLSPKIPTEGVQTLVFTSAHAVRAFAALKRERHFTCYVVGLATGDAAREAGFEPIEGGGTAQSLAEKLLKDGPAEPILYLRGNHIAFDLADALAQSGTDFRQTVVYDQRERHLTEEAQTTLATASGVVLPLFSPRSAKLFFDNQTWRGRLFVGAMSENVARNVPEESVAMLSTAQSPSASAMLDVVEQLWTSANRLEGKSSAK
ncbi:uroporphyrinogen-III synthase [Roseovarius rhodophyticola]|uniref:Uroporphyrinogen-III synthase n=1 Tax=Roseovarius rhodophyticola TaxID=3080827 RepID=A0ABZ2TNF8_9RHOB|nr:uroporphyrinogen-III synthase [Roseovarius sp. W115]MDV2930016.1 uroporphyrinogen-III synthase [Roseovarius sp. W115]